MNLIRYESWSPRPRGATRLSHPIGSTLGVTLHWEGPHMGVFPHSECADHIRGIQRFHIEGRGWADIAYNAVVCPHGIVFEGRGPGTTSAANGNTTDNADWYAVCYLGGERDPFTDPGKAGFIDAVQWLRDAGDAGPLVNGHRDHKATACPGNQIYDWLHNHDWTPQEDDMFEPTDREKLEETLQAVKDLAVAERERAKRTRERDQRIAKRLRVVANDAAADLRARLVAIADELGQDSEA